ncbi:MAG TPA: winged helix-turn-helix domain-containing protein [Candidatus Sulfotelmatobacter sp.]|nr:winged helix-turn-helix domain-containing protein [Candidatus Sulfotelmatobacter sp.]
MNDKIYTFGEFELSVADGELRSEGVVVRLQQKPLLLLTALLEHRQRVVSRDQLRLAMWGSETFVDYEQGINVAIKKVRDALGDSAENPRFIETVAKKGYRFLLPVKETEDAGNAVMPAVLPPGGAALASNSRAPGRVLRRGWVIALAGIVAVAVLGLRLFPAQSAKARHTGQIRSIAVLPLRNLSGDAGQEYLADGVTEDVITSLAQTLPLRVISRTSVMRYKEASAPITQIARELGVEAIVEGAVARSGQRITVTFQLIDATEDRHLWARRYDRDLRDLPDVEAEASQQIAARLGGAPDSQLKRDLANGRSADPEVYELCLLGRYHWNQRTAASLTKAVKYYQRAIQRDPAYAPAYAGLANGYALMPSYSDAGIGEASTKAAAAARHALELDEGLAEAHATLGFLALNKRDWRQGGVELRRALELNPNDATNHHWYAFYLLFSARSDEALAEMETARGIDPLSAVITADEGQFLYILRRYAEAALRLRRAIELSPEFGQPHLTLALINWETGDSSGAVTEARAGLALSSTNPRTIAEAGYVLAITGHATEARMLLETLKHMVRRGTAVPVFTALIHMGLGERDEALKALEQHAKLGGIEGLSQWHAFDQLNSEPRFQELLAESGGVYEPSKLQ